MHKSRKEWVTLLVFVCKEWQERIALVSLFKIAICSRCLLAFYKEKFALLFFYKSKAIKCDTKFLSLVFSFPTLKKSKSLFHKEEIALVLKKLKEWLTYFALVALLKRLLGVNRSCCYLSKEQQVRKSKERKSERAKEQRAKEWRAKKGKSEEWKSEEGKSEERKSEERKSEKVKERKSERAKEQKSKFPTLAKGGRLSALRYDVVLDL